MNNEVIVGQISDLKKYCCARELTFYSELGGFSVT